MIVASTLSLTSFFPASPSTCSLFVAIDAMIDCLLSADDAFGPAIRGCRNNFDFTLLFEQSFFQIAPCALLLLLLPLQASRLRQQNVKTSRSGFRTVKQAAITVYAATQLALLVTWSIVPTYRTRCRYLRPPSHAWRLWPYFSCPALSTLGLSNPAR